MKIGLVGYQSSGKTTLFQWLTGMAADPTLVHRGQTAVVPLPEPRLQKLAEIYQSKKITPAGLEIVDTPGLSRSHEGNPARLALIREADCLVLVLAAYDGSDPWADYRSLEDDFLLADMEIVSGRIHRIEQALTKPLPKTEKEQLVHEQQILQGVLRAMESGQPLQEAQMTEAERRMTRAFRLLTEKPRFLLVNTADTEADPQRFVRAVPAQWPCWAVPLDLEWELSQMNEEDRQAFEKEMGLQGTDKAHLLRALVEASGQIVFFTANQREVRAWLLREGGTALEAAAQIHTDLARGFIRADVIPADQLIRLGSEREAKAHHLVRSEHKDYPVQDGDLLYIHFNV
jgi:ribosome-binding ATPase YchF (GTP1/OBG family)